MAELCALVILCMFQISQDACWMSRPFSQTRLDDVRPIGVQSFQECEEHDNPGLVNLKVYEDNNELRRNVTVGNPSTKGGIPAMHSAGVEC